MPLSPPSGRATTAFALFAGFAAAALILAAAGLTGFSQLNRSNAELRATAEARNHKLALVEDLREAIEMRSSALVSMVTTKDGGTAPQERERLQAVVPVAMDAFRSALAGLRALGLGPEEERLIESVAATLERTDRAFRAAEGGASRPPRSVTLAAAEAREELDHAISRFAELQRVSAFREVANATEANRSALRSAIVIMVLALVASLLVGLATTALVIRSERQLKRGKVLAQATLDGIREGVISVDGDGRVQFMNPRAEALTGWTFAEARGRSLAEVYRLVGREARETRVHPAVRPGNAPMSSGDGSVLIARDGREYEVQDSASPVRDDAAGIAGAVLVFRDLTEERSLQRELAWQALHDKLTGLPNREEFEQHLATALEQAAQGAQHALLFLDLDQFNVINDTCGHVGGDQLLRRVADLLREVLTPRDLIARLSGDDFAVLLRDRTPQEARAVAEELLRRVRALRFTWQGKTLQITTSIGVVPLDGAQRGIAETMGAADIACFAAKEAGRDTLSVHQPEGESAARRQVMGMVADIRRAIDKGSFMLYQQRIQGLNETTRGERHYEILLRMVDEDGTLRLPGSFLPAAERYNLMKPIDRWVIGEALARLAALFEIDPALRDAVYTLNLSGATLNDPGFPAFLNEMLARHAVPPRALCFEITETMAISNLNRASDLMHDVKSAGCAFALDDFGIGMSSFAYLKHLPVDYLKIDGAFIRNLLTERIDHDIVEAIARICRALDIRTVAEFVEEEAMMPALAALGIDYAQGYAVGRPQPLA
jgi:diguanylate cyclase (GGDEF)-like protein/PAS domain S-box-containing protein